MEERNKGLSCSSKRYILVYFLHYLYFTSLLLSTWLGVQVTTNTCLVLTQVLVFSSAQIVNTAKPRLLHTCIPGCRSVTLNHNVVMEQYAGVLLVICLLSSLIITTQMSISKLFNTGLYLNLQAIIRQ